MNSLPEGLNQGSSQNDEPSWKVTPEVHLGKAVGEPRKAGIVLVVAGERGGHGGGHATAPAVGIAARHVEGIAEQGPHGLLAAAPEATCAEGVRVACRLGVGQLRAGPT